MLINGLWIVEFRASESRIACEQVRFSSDSTIADLKFFTIGLGL